MAVLQFGLHFSSLSLDVLQLSRQFFNFLIVLLRLYVRVCVVQLLQLRLLVLVLHLLSLELLSLLFGLHFNLVGSVRLLLDLLVERRGHELGLFREHMQSLFGLGGLLSQELVPVRQLIIRSLLLQILLGQIRKLLLEGLSLLLFLVPGDLLLFESVLSLLRLQTGLLAVFVVLD